MTTSPYPDRDPLAEGERWAAEAFAALHRGAPALDRDAVWARIGTEVASARGRSNGWLASLPSLFTTRALTAAGVAAAAVVVAAALTLSSGGGRADAALLEAARSLSSATDSALADGTLSHAELDALRNEAERLLADIVADPAGLERLSADDLAALATILNSLEDRLRATEAAATPTLRKVESAAGLATSALRDSDPERTVVSLGAARDERFTVASIGSQTVLVADAGSVVIEVQANSLTLVGTTANPGWTVEVESVAGRELEADFRSADTRVKFNAELEDGVLRTRIETDGTSTSSASSSTSGNSNNGGSASSSDDSEDDDRDSEDEDRDDQNRDETRFVHPEGTTASYDIPGAGFVILFRTNNGLTITGTSVTPGWTVEVGSPSGREVEADFRNGLQRIKFNAELEDGQVRIRIETEGVSASSTPSTGSSDDDDDKRDDDDDDEGDDHDKRGSNSGSGSGS